MEGEVDKEREIGIGEEGGGDGEERVIGEEVAGISRGGGDFVEIEKDVAEAYSGIFLPPSPNCHGCLQLQNFAANPSAKCFYHVEKFDW